MARLQDLPPELLQHRFSFNNLYTLHLTRVCKSFRANAEPSLYHTFKVAGREGNRIPLHFIRTLLERPALAKHVRKLDLGFWPCERSLPGDRPLKEGWATDDHVIFEKIARTVGVLSFEASTAGPQYGPQYSPQYGLQYGLQYGPQYGPQQGPQYDRDLSGNDTTDYILLLALLSLLPALQELHLCGANRLSVPYSLIQKVAGLPWANSYFAGKAWGLPNVKDGQRILLAQAQQLLTQPPFTTLPASKFTDTINASRIGLISFGRTVTNIELNDSPDTREALEGLIRLPRTLKSFSCAPLPRHDFRSDVSPGAVVDILYQHHAQSLESLTIDFKDEYVGWQDATSRLYRSKCLRKFTNLTHLQVKQHMLLRVQLDMKSIPRRHIFMPLGDILPPSLISLTLFECDKYSKEMFVVLAESLQHKLPRLAELIIDHINTWRDMRDVQIHESFKVRFRGYE